MPSKERLLTTVGVLVGAASLVGVGYWYRGFRSNSESNEVANN